MTHTIHALGHIGFHRASTANTLLAHVPFYADLNQFEYPDQVLASALACNMADPVGEEVLVGDVRLAVTFFDQRTVETLDGLQADIPAQLADPALFDPRAGAIMEVVLPYFERCPAPLRGERVAGLAVVEHISSLPEIAPLEILAAALEKLKLLTASGGGSLLFVHSEQDLQDDLPSLHRKMADHLAFARRHPQLRVTTFREIGPLAGTLAGIIAPEGRWQAGDDWTLFEGNIPTDPTWRDPQATPETLQ